MLTLPGVKIILQLDQDNSKGHGDVVVNAGGSEYRPIRLSLWAGVEAGVNAVTGRAYVALDDSHNWNEGDDAITQHENRFGVPVVEDIRGDRLWYEWDVPKEYVKEVIESLM